MFVLDTLNVIVGLRLGVPPGSRTLRMLIRLRKPGSVPMMYPSVAVGSSLSTPRGAYGPANDELPMLGNPVTTIGPPLKTLDLRITNALVWKLHVNMLQPV